jgi:predicted nucleic acid-binding protein
MPQDSGGRPASWLSMTDGQRGWARGRDYDRMIAAHAISSGSILVTNNAPDFRDIPGLSMINWVV